jgi:O-antigen ligase
MNTSLNKLIQNVDWQQLAFALAAIVVGAGAALLMMRDVVEPVLIIAGVIALLGSAVIFLKPDLGLIGLVVIVYSNLSDVLRSNYGAPSIAQPFISFLCFVLVGRWALFGERLRGWKLPLLLIGLYGFVTFLSLFYARSFDTALVGVTDYVKLAIIALLITILLRRAPTFSQVIWALIGVGAFLATISVIQSLTGTFDNNYGGFARPPVVNVSDGEETARTAGPIGDPNFYSQLLIVVLPLALDRFWNARSQSARLAAGYALAVIIVTLLLTFSRGAFLASVLVLGIMFIGRRINPMALLVTPLVLVALLQFAPPNYTERLMTLADFLPGQSSAGSTDYSFRGRTSEMIAALMMFRDYPLLGVGVGNYNVRYLEYSRVIGLDGRLENRSAHSLYLEIAAERGLFGLVGFGALTGTALYNLFRSARLLNQNGHANMGGLMKALGAGMIGYLFTSIFLHDAFPRYFWLLIGICLSTMFVARDELRRAKDEQPAPDALTPSAIEGRLA